MKYSSTNQLEHFKFHGSVWTLEQLIEKTLAVSIRHLNVYKETPQNDSDFDMEIDIAKVTFQGFSDLTFESGRTWMRGDDGQCYTDEPLVIYEAEDAHNKLMKELQAGLTVYYLEIDDKNICSVKASGNSTYFIVRFAYDSVSVEWEEYCRKEWRKLQEQYKRQLHLSTPVGDQLSDAVIDISYYVDDMDCDRDLEYNYHVAIGVQYEGQEFWGRGTSYYWEDAFADLQKQLPSDVTLKCCLTCRHGNMCPVGNEQDELFCTEDVLIKQKGDLNFYTEDYDEREKRLRGYTSVCGKHQPQTEDFFTYNDYLYQFNK